MILQEIATKTRERVEKCKKIKSLEVIKKEALSQSIDNNFRFEKALKEDGIGFICEVKKASPSKGVIAEEFPYVSIAKEYERAGASAISVLTEPYYFQGKDDYLTQISQKVSIPILRKDFTIDEYMIYEAKLIGADAVLLICTILSQEQLKEYIDISHSLGLSALVEAHTEEEIKIALSAGARVIGVNNRNLKNFKVDIENSIRLRNLVPPDILYISESGIKTSKDIKRLVYNKVDAVLIGETFMLSKNKKDKLRELRGEIT